MIMVCVFRVILLYQMARQINAIEGDNMRPKSWQMSGEARSRDRPLNRSAVCTSDQAEHVCVYAVCTSDQAEHVCVCSLYL